MDQTLVVRNMSMTFGGQRALDEVSLSIRRGEVHGLVGQNGCGKSTLIKILAGYHHPDPGGELEIDGRPVKLPVRTGSASELGHELRAPGPRAGADTDGGGELPRLDDLATTPSGAISLGQGAERTEEAFARFGVRLDPRAGRGRPAARGPRAAGHRPCGGRSGASTRKEDERAGGLLVLDEPTVFLPRADRDGSST